MHIKHHTHRISHTYTQGCTLKHKHKAHIYLQSHTHRRHRQTQTLSHNHVWLCTQTQDTLTLSPLTLARNQLSNKTHTHKSKYTTLKSTLFSRLMHKHNYRERSENTTHQIRRTKKAFLSFILSFFLSFSNSFCPIIHSVICISVIYSMTVVRGNLKSHKIFYVEHFFVIFIQTLALVFAEKYLVSDIPFLQIT